MVLLENLNLNDLDLSKFRQFKSCPCELCDDGCFDRTRQVHSANCKKNSQKATVFEQPAGIQREKSLLSLSHYKDTFKAHYDARPSTAYRPPTNNYDYVPRGRMDLNTIQKTAFKAPPIGIERQKAVKITDSYELPKEPFSGQTSYRSEYVARENNAFSKIVRRNANETTTRKPVNEKISDNTTSKEHFKAPYHHSSSSSIRSIGGGEYPSFAGDALFPTRERSFTTSTKSIHHAPSYSSFEDLVAKVPSQKDKDSIKPEGDIDLVTNYRETYKKHANVERSRLQAPVANASIIADKKPMLEKTQNQIDFKYPFNHQPPKPAACNPYISDLDKQILYPGNFHEHNTIYTSEYKGHDPKENPVPKSFNPGKTVYEKPTEKFDTETVTMRDFKPIDLSKIPALKAIKMTNRLKIPAGPMETLTMSKIQFVPYNVCAPVLAKDPNPYYYMPPRQKFNAQTTTAQTYMGAKGMKSVSCKPDFGNINSEGEIDFTTMYQNDFIKHGLSMCEAKAFLIAKSKAATATATIAATNRVLSSASASSNN